MRGGDELHFVSIAPTAVAVLIPAEFSRTSVAAFHLAKTRLRLKLLLGSFHLVHLLHSDSRHLRNHRQACEMAALYE